MLSSLTVRCLHPSLTAVSDANRLLPRQSVLNWPRLTGAATFACGTCVRGMCPPSRGTSSAVLVPSQIVCAACGGQRPATFCSAARPLGACWCVGTALCVVVASAQVYVCRRQGWDLRKLSVPAFGLKAEPLAVHSWDVNRALLGAGVSVAHGAVVSLAAAGSDDGRCGLVALLECASAALLDPMTGDVIQVVKSPSISGGAGTLQHGGGACATLCITALTFGAALAGAEQSFVVSHASGVLHPRLCAFACRQSKDVMLAGTLRVLSLYFAADAPRACQTLARGNPRMSCQ